MCQPGRLDFFLIYFDEVGYIHPSQFAALKEEMSDSFSTQDVEHESTNFWNRDHKLGISTQILIPVYKAAKNAFISVLRQYKTLGSFSGKLGDDTLESQVMIHSKALLLLSCDFCTAWNSRRWVINMISGNCSTLQWIIERESELVEKIAERSKMNYRAWNHRCWLVSYMTREQVLYELKKSRNWSGLHVADNSCFHYRRMLMLRNIKDFCRIQENNSSGYDVETYQAWKEELDWNESLIKHYVGREALWLHRRFLSLYLIKHIATSVIGVSCQSKPKTSEDLDINSLMEHELRLVQPFFIIPDDNFEDFEAQAIYSATYMLWLTKQIPEYQGIDIQEKLRAGDLARTLKKACPDRSSLWDYLVDYHSEGKK